MTTAIPWLQLNGLEAAAAALVFGVIFYGKRISAALPDGIIDWDSQQRTLKYIFAAIILIAVLFSVSETTQFMTVDEAMMADSMLNKDERSVWVWHRGSFHSSLPIYLGIGRLGELAGIRHDLNLALMKLLHWTIGLFLIIGITATLVRLVKPLYEPFFISMMFAAILFLPISSTALKTLNYDSLSLFGSVLALLIAFLNLREPRWSSAVAAIVLATLAAQEKLNASVILLVVCVLVGAAAGLHSVKRRWLVGIGAACASAVAAIAVSLVSAICMAVALTGDPLQKEFLPAFRGIHEPLVSWAFAPAIFLFNTTVNLATIADRTRFSLAILPPTIFAIGVAAALWMWLTDAGFLERVGQRVQAWTIKFGVPGIIFLGVLGLILVTPVWAPMIKIPEGGFNVGGINNNQLHFRNSNVIGHFFYAVIFAYGVFIAAMPSFISFSVIFIWFNGSNKTAPRFVYILLLVAIIIPAASAFVGIPTFARYMNISLLMFLISSVVLITTVSARWSLPANAALVVFAAAMILIEVLPFRPLYAAFRPITVNYADKNVPLSGVANFSWTGWGEESLLAGKKMEELCNDRRIDCAGATLRPLYFSYWFTTGPIKVEPVRIGASLEGLPYTATDFYVVNRQSVVGGFFSELPPVPAEFTVKYRGFIIAWIYRGDKLKSAGYVFKAP